jgi:hypothetical protein
VEGLLVLPNLGVEFKKLLPPRADIVGADSVGTGNNLDRFIPSLLLLKLIPLVNLNSSPIINYNLYYIM